MPQKWIRVVVTLGNAASPNPSRGRTTHRNGGRGGDFGGNASKGSSSQSMFQRMMEQGEDSTHDSSDSDSIEMFGRSNGSNREFIGGREYGLGLGGIPSGGIPQARPEKVLTTYVNSKVCSVINSSTRGVLATTDGRFAIDPAGFNFCGSSNLKCMPGGVSVRYIELRRGAADSATVKEEAFRNRIFSTLISL